MYLELVGRDDVVGEPQRRDAEDFRQRRFALDVAGILQAAVELPKDRLPCVSTDAENERHGELRLIGRVEALKSLEILLREIVEAGAGLLGLRCRSERGSA